MEEQKRKDEVADGRRAKPGESDAQRKVRRTAHLEEEKRGWEERRDAADTKLLEQLKATSSGDLGPGIAPQVIIDTFEEKETKAVLEEAITKLSAKAAIFQRGAKVRMETTVRSACI